ncbi:MAG: hypothetical protein F4039_08440 [Gammaproteobacteria bacterium]|nr:hypothetical protein [Gammaproteobacteria bacterium]MXX94908.1 hypothetical protein [Gammaproteobacteria bacterium]MYF53372.1 hypothetical protein [Gammaproteobacteria bacterium]MYK44100.1 hypothetical protein [Gammaproteobacteria bacterium]
MLVDVFEVLYLSLGLVFLYAGVAKVKDFQELLLAIEHQQFIPEFMTKNVALIVVGIELILALGFIFGVFLSVTLWTSLVMIIGITILSRIFQTGEKQNDCMCFGQDEVLLKSWKSWSRAILMIAGVCVGIVLFYLLPEVDPLSMSLDTLLISLIVLLLLSWVTDIAEVKNHAIDP